MQLSLMGAVSLALASIFIPPPQRLPDLFQLLTAVYSCAHFFMFALYFHMKQFGGVYEDAVLKFLNGSHRKSVTKNSVNVGTSISSSTSSSWSLSSTTSTKSTDTLSTMSLRQRK